LPVVSSSSRVTLSKPSHDSVHRFRALAIFHECLDAVRSSGCKAGAIVR
jgi:hypothetical protein